MAGLVAAVEATSAAQTSCSWRRQRSWGARCASRAASCGATATSSGSARSARVEIPALQRVVHEALDATSSGSSGSAPMSLEHSTGNPATRGVRFSVRSLVQRARLRVSAIFAFASRFGTCRGHAGHPRNRRLPGGARSGEEAHHARGRCAPAASDPVEHRRRASSRRSRPGRGRSAGWTSSTAAHAGSTRAGRPRALRRARAALRAPCDRRERCRRALRAAELVRDRRRAVDGAATGRGRRTACRGTDVRSASASGPSATMIEAAERAGAVVSRNGDAWRSRSSPASRPRWGARGSIPRPARPTASSRPAATSAASRPAATRAGSRRHSCSGGERQRLRWRRHERVLVRLGVHDRDGGGASAGRSHDARACPRRR